MRKFFNFIYLFVSLFILLFAYLFYYLLLYLFIYLFIYLSICYFIYLFIYLFILLFAYLFYYLFIYLSVFLFICLLTYLYILLFHSQSVDFSGEFQMIENEESALRRENAWMASGNLFILFLFILNSTLIKFYFILLNLICIVFYFYRFLFLLYPILIISYFILFNLSLMKSCYSYYKWLYHFLHSHIPASRILWEHISMVMSPALPFYIRITTSMYLHLYFIISTSLLFYLYLFAALPLYIRNSTSSTFRKHLQLITTFCCSDEWRGSGGRCSFELKQIVSFLSNISSSRFSNFAAGRY